MRQKVRLFILYTCVSVSWQQYHDGESNIGPQSAATCCWLLVDPGISR